MEKKQTPIEELIDELMVGELSQKISNYNRMNIIGWLNKNKLLEKEKQVIVDAFVQGNREVFYDGTEEVMANAYYNNKYSK
jgi:hypothetical protein